MGYSLLNRFRGVWLGSIIARELTTQQQQIKISQPNVNRANETLQQWFSSSEREIDLTIQKQWNFLLYTLGEKPVTSVADKDLILGGEPSRVILLGLLAIIYYHDDWSSLGNLFAKPEKNDRESAENIDNILVWCCVVRLALRGELANRGLTERVVMRTRLQRESYSIQWLKKVEVSCLEGWSSKQLIKELSSMKDKEIPLSLFCFFNNPEDFYLTVRQALSMRGQGKNIPALSGALSGAYNGLTGIPGCWRYNCQDRDFYRQVTLKTGEMVEKWCGVISAGDSPIFSSVITSPKILQPRSSLKIISQQEY